MYALNAISTTDCARRLEASRLAADAYLTQRAAQAARDHELRARVKPITACNDAQLRVRAEEDPLFKVKSQSAASAPASAPSAEKKGNKKAKNVLLDPSFFASTSVRASVAEPREAPAAQSRPAGAAAAQKDEPLSWRRK